MDEVTHVQFLYNRSGRVVASNFRSSRRSVIHTFARAAFYPAVKMVTGPFQLDVIGGRIAGDGARADPPDLSL